jgi:hypothetical protein
MGLAGQAIVADDARIERRNGRLTMDRNCWFQRGDVLMSYLKSSFSPAQFADFQRQSKLDAHSIVADPKFINPAKLDFRLAPDSTARKLATGGGPVGARRRLKE